MIKRTKQRIGDLGCVIVDATNDAPAAAVILCHGFGAPPTDLVSIANEMISQNEELAKAVFIFPGAPLELDPTFDGRAWWMIDMEKVQQMQQRGETREMRSTSPKRLPVCRGMIEEVVEFVKTRYSLAANQIVIGGFSQGAMLTTDVALNHDELLGGLIVFFGWQFFTNRENLAPLNRVDIVILIWVNFV